MLAREVEVWVGIRKRKRKKRGFEKGKDGRKMDRSGVREKGEDWNRKRDKRSGVEEESMQLKSCVQPHHETLINTSKFIISKVLP